MTMKCAVVGIGHRAHSWLNAIVNTYDNAQLVALCDTMAARCEDVNNGYGTSAAVYTDYAQMLAGEDLDLVVVTSPESCHREHIVGALDAGCHVATEKPLCTTGEDARAILDAEERNSRKVFMGFNYRHIPLCMKIKELILAGTIGEPQSVDLTWYLDYRGHGASYFRRWHRRMAISGGLLITKATHHFDLANWFIGDVPESVYARCHLNFFGPQPDQPRGERCRDCPHADACDFYYDILDKERKARELGYQVNIVRDYEGDMCVFADEIDIYDTHAVTVQYRGGCVMNYTLNASVPFEGWNLAINGTRGRLESGITDCKPQPGWQEDFKVVVDGRVLPEPEGRIVWWPQDYRIHVMPNDKRNDYQVRIPNIATGHGGGDDRLFDKLFGDGGEEADPLHIYASAIDGARSMVIGAAANRSAATGDPIQVADLLGPWATA